MERAPIRVGIGGWVFAPWKQTFYPPGLPASRHLAYAAGVLGSIEINATFHRTQTPESFARWAAETPDGFCFAVKAARGATQRGRLAEGAESVARFLGSGLAALGDRLGPILWQLAPTKRFDRDDLAAFFDLLPAALDGIPLRHAVEARHASFATGEADHLFRERNVARVLVDPGDAGALPEPTADFVYARLKGTRPDEPNGYSAAEIERWAGIFDGWATGAAGKGHGKPAPRPCFVYVIAGAKERAPLAAQALIGALGLTKG